MDEFGDEGGGVGEDVGEGEFFEDEPVEGEVDEFDGGGVAGEAGVEVGGDVGVDVGADAVGEEVAEVGAAGGFEAEFDEGEVAVGEDGDAVDEFVHESGEGGVVAGAVVDGGEVVGDQVFVDAVADLDEEVVAVGEVVGRGAGGDCGVGVHRAEGEPAGPVAGEDGDRGVEQRGAAVGVVAHGSPRLTPLHL